MKTPVDGLDTDLLRAFVMVVECGSFSQAAARLLRGQSAVSLQIKRLETRLGARLLERSPHHVALTPEGEMILDHARRILALSEEMIARASGETVEGRVRLGVPEDFATTHLPPALASFARSHPKVTIEVTCELTLQVLERFRAGGLDLAFVKRLPAGPAGGTRVWREPLVWVGADAGAAATGELALAVSPRPCVYRRRATEALDAIGRPWRIAYSCGALAGTHAAVRAGLGVTVLPKEMVPHDLVILDEAAAGLPDLADTEIALLEAAGLSAAATRLRAHVLHQLERAH